MRKVILGNYTFYYELSKIDVIVHMILTISFIKMWTTT
jgi:hypothetical protein